jgi:hypothetical protein
MTKAQEQVRAALRARGFVGRAFSAQEAFPGTTPEDNANRRVLGSLAREGYLEKPDQGREVYQLATQDQRDDQERETSLGHKAEQERGQEMGL